MIPLAIMVFALVFVLGVFVLGVVKLIAIFTRIARTVRKYDDKS